MDYLLDAVWKNRRLSCEVSGLATLGQELIRTLVQDYGKVITNYIHTSRSCESEIYTVSGIEKILSDLVLYT